MKIIKICILSIILSCAFSGCKSNDTYCQIEPKPTTNYSQRFNDTQYIWESLYFPTNRTSGVQ